MILLGWDRAVHAFLAPVRLRLAEERIFLQDAGRKIDVAQKLPGRGLELEAVAIHVVVVGDAEARFHSSFIARAARDGERFLGFE